MILILMKNFLNYNKNLNNIFGQRFTFFIEEIINFLLIDKS